MDGNAAESKGGKGKTKPAVKSSRVDHTYFDYSTRHVSELIDGNEKKNKRVTFPMKLHAIISNPDHSSIICWMPHGRSWKILDRGLLVTKICKDNFNHQNFGSFNRSVNGES